MSRIEQYIAPLFAQIYARLDTLFAQIYVRHDTLFAQIYVRLDISLAKNEQSECLFRPHLFIPTVPV
jgi:hypothetical protein